VFRDIFISELEPNSQKNILNPNLREAGVRFITAINSVLSGVCGDSVYLAVIDFGTSF
jgi:hypothetical protein